MIDVLLYLTIGFIIVTGTFFVAHIFNIGDISGAAWLFIGAIIFWPMFSIWVILFIVLACSNIFLRLLQKTPQFFKKNEVLNWIFQDFKISQCISEEQL